MLRKPSRSPLPQDDELQTFFACERPKFRLPWKSIRDSSKWPGKIMSGFGMKNLVISLGLSTGVTSTEFILSAPGLKLAVEPLLSNPVMEYRSAFFPLNYTGTSPGSCCSCILIRDVLHECTEVISFTVSVFSETLIVKAKRTDRLAIFYSLFF